MTDIFMKGIKIVIFIVILLALLLIIQSRFVPYNDRYSDIGSTFYEIPKNSIDVLITGTSTALTGISPLTVYEGSGITSYSRCNAFQPPQITYLNVKEALKYQRPKLVICTVKSLLWDKSVDDMEPGGIYIGLDYKKVSIDKALIAWSIARESEQYTFCDLAFPLVRYHDRWDTSFEDIMMGSQNQWNTYRGHDPKYICRSIEEKTKTNMGSTEKVKLSKESLLWYKKIADLCAKNNIELLLIELPSNSWTMEKHDVVSEVADKLNAKFLDYNCDGIIQECEIDWNLDFLDGGHLNTRGSVKASKYLGRYIQDEFGMKKSNITKEVEDQFKRDLLIFKNEAKSTEYEYKEEDL